jgi:sugar-specific transcriptional regulator TrmB
MLDKDDVRVLGGMFERQEQKFEKRFGELDQKIDGLRSEMRQEFGKVREEMSQGFKTVRDDIIDVIDQNIQPQLTSSTARIARLERRIA